MKKTDLLVKFGKMIAELRKARHLSQEQLAFDAGLSRSHVGMIERAEKNVTLSTVENLAKGLEVDVKELFEF